MKIFTTAEIPDELAKEWLQHLRDFDIAHPGCHFSVGVDAPNMRMAEMIEMLRVEPELTFQQLFDREKEKMETMRRSLRKSGLKIGPDDN